MSLNGSGTYVVNSAGQPVVASTLITAAAFNAFTADIATALSTAVFKDGQQTITANLPMGGFRLTGVGSGNSSRTMSASTGDLQDNLANWAGTAGGTANALTLTPTPAITAYLAGQSFVFKAGASANTSTTTVAISGLTAIAVQVNGAACAGGELQANRWYRLTLDSTSTGQVEPLGVNVPAQGGTGVANNAASTITISGAFPITVTLTASTGVTLPTTGTLATLAGTETVTNKTVNLTSNTLTGTIAQFNTALSDADFATLAGTESLTNKKLGSLTTNGFVKTGSGDGTLSVDTSTYITSSALPSASIAGLTVSNNGITPTTDLDFAAGQCRDRAYSWAFATDTGSSLTTSLTAYWKLNEATGIRKDSYNWYDMAATRAQPTSAAGKSGAAALFASASSQYLQVPAATDLQLGNISVTFAGWVKLTSKVRGFILSQSDGTNPGAAFYISYESGSDRFEVNWFYSSGNNATATANTFGAPSTDTWYFLVVYHNASNNTIGISVNNGAFNTTSATGGMSVTSPWAFGCQLAAIPETFFNGAIDEWGVWRKVLSSQEITDLYNSGNGQTLTETISDSTNMTCAAQTAKRLSSAWSAGSSGGLLDTGSIAASKTYHLFAIQKADGTQDYVASLNPKKPTLPSGYLYYRRIRSVRTNGSSQVIAETQVGNAISYAAHIADSSGTTPDSATAKTISTPLGIRVVPIWSVEYTTGVSVNSRVWVSPLDIADASPDTPGPNSNSVTANSLSGGRQTASPFMLTSKSGQVRMRSDYASATHGIYTYGYSDPDILGAGR